MNAKLIKVEKEEDKSTPAYDGKASFFDSISHGNEAVKTRETREERVYQRNIDNETFGENDVRSTEQEIYRANRGRYGRYRQNRGRRGRPRYRRY